MNFHGQRGDPRRDHSLILPSFLSAPCHTRAQQMEARQNNPLLSLVFGKPQEYRCRLWFLSSDARIPQPLRVPLREMTGPFSQACESPAIQIPVSAFRPISSKTRFPSKFSAPIFPQNAEVFSPCPRAPRFQDPQHSE